jgi:hypothetical protein
MAALISRTSNFTFREEMFMLGIQGYFQPMPDLDDFNIDFFKRCRCGAETEGRFCLKPLGENTEA